MINKLRLVHAILMGLILGMIVWAIANWTIREPSGDVTGSQTGEPSGADQSPPALEATSARPLGLLEDPGHLKNVPDASFNTVWIMVDAHGYLRIYAGYLASDPDQGILAVVQEYDWQTYLYLLPEKEGELRIVGFENGRLNLVTALGTTWFFDVETRTFLAGNQE